MRKDGRQENELRPITMIRDFTDTKGGSVLIGWGNTRVLCTALLEAGPLPPPPGTATGGRTAEYAMLPSSTGNRKKRDYLKQDGRATEIQRLIGRSLRAGVDMMKLGERVIYVDCDVLQADGGTRTASITGAYVAVALGVEKWLKEGRLEENPLIHRIAAVSVGIVNDRPLLDLRYGEDSAAQVDMNLVMNEAGEFIEIQGTGEGRSFSREELDSLLTLGEEGICTLMEKQRETEKSEP